MASDNRNSEVPIPEKVTEFGAFHETRAAASHAARLVSGGSTEELAQAEAVLDIVLACQERREGDAHLGNFRWMREDDFVEDLNAVEFVLDSLIIMMRHHGDRLSPEMRNRVLESIRLGLVEIQNLDVLVAYTNITALDILNSCLGGELLGDARIAERGYRKLSQWMAFTGQSGTPYEYNSPTYTAVTLRALKTLSDNVQHVDTRIRARTMAARLGLSVALHIHAGTGRWAGPHSRAYHPTVVCENPPEIRKAEAWVLDGTVPGWIEGILRNRPEPYEITETAYVPYGMGLTTYQSASFALGVSSKLMSEQSNVLMMHYTREGAERPGVLYTRYLTNDKWFGDFYHPTDRSKSRNLNDEGQFYGVQNGSRALGVYAPPMLAACSSAKAVLVWTQHERIDEIWIGGTRIESLPADIPEGETVVVASGDALVAVRPLTRTDLGRDSPIRLAELDRNLVLEIHNYLGPRKTFWELSWPGAFYKGQPQCGLYLEAAERSDYDCASHFRETVDRGTLSDHAAAPFVYAGEGDRIWRIEYSREGKSLGMDVDLMQWELRRRWTETGEMGWPMLESPFARETRSGRVRVGDATLTCGQAAAWLAAIPSERCWIAGYQGADPAPLTLMVPGGSVEIQSMGTGMVVWRDGDVTVEAVDLQGTPRITKTP